MIGWSGALGGTRTHSLSLRRAALYPLELQARVGLVPREGFEPTRAYAHYALNVARLPFRHLGTRPSGKRPSPGRSNTIKDTLLTLTWQPLHVRRSVVRSFLGREEAPRTRGRGDG